MVGWPEPAATPTIQVDVDKICPGWVEGMMAVGQTGARHPWISLEFYIPRVQSLGVRIGRVGGKLGADLGV